MRIFEVLAGRKIGNYELPAKETFMAAIEADAKIEMVKGVLVL